jgi:hypothetical protein
MAAMAETRDSLRDINIHAAQALSQKGIWVWNITNSDELAILPEDAIIPGFGRTYPLGRSLGDHGHLAGHSQVLESAEVAQDIALILSHTPSLPEVSTDPLHGSWVVENPDWSTTLYAIAFYLGNKVVLVVQEGDFRGNYSYTSSTNVSLDIIGNYNGSAEFQTSYGFRIESDRLSLTGEQVIQGQTYQRVNALEQSYFDSVTCPGAVPSQMVVGQMGLVSITDGSTTRLRSNPGTNSAILLDMPESTYFYVIGGPECTNGFTWWNVQLRDQDISGWVAEGSDGKYFIWPLPLPSDFSFDFGNEVTPVQNNNDSLLLGTWDGVQGNVWTFNPDGTYVWEVDDATGPNGIVHRVFNGTYTADGHTLTMTENGGQVFRFNYQVDISGSAATIVILGGQSGGISLDFHRR